MAGASTPLRYAQDKLREVIFVWKKRVLRHLQHLAMTAPAFWVFLWSGFCLTVLRAGTLSRLMIWATVTLLRLRKNACLDP